MKITLFTSNNNRHNYFINLLSEFCDDLFVVQECRTIFPGIIPGIYPASENIKNYFDKVNEAQIKLFGQSYINNTSKNIKVMTMQAGDLNNCSLTFLSDFLKRKSSKYTYGCFTVLSRNRLQFLGSIR